MRTGLVSFGQGLFYCIGGYAAGVAGKDFGVTDVFVLLALGIVASAVDGRDPGPAACRYREIFFAMFTMALLDDPVRPPAEVAEAGLDRRLQRRDADVPGLRAGGASVKTWVFALAVVLTFVVAIVLHRYLRSGMGYSSEASATTRSASSTSACRRSAWSAVEVRLRGGARVARGRHPGAGVRPRRPARWRTGRRPASSFSSRCSAAPRTSARSFLAAVIFEFIKHVRVRALAVHVADVPRRGAARDHHVPAEGPVVAAGARAEDVT